MNNFIDVVTPEGEEKKAEVLDIFTVEGYEDKDYILYTFGKEVDENNIEVFGSVLCMQNVQRPSATTLRNVLVIRISHMAA